MGRSFFRPRPEKTFEDDALGRGVEYYDAPAVRRIVREARANDFRFSSFILGIVKSTPFQMRRSQ